MKEIIVAVIVKQEYDYIKEFVEYHLNLGFDKIYIGDNNDDNDEHYEELLSEYISTNKVKILTYRHKPSQQIEFYNYIIKNVDYEWCAFIDCDEFLTFNRESGFVNIKDFLKSNPKITNYHVNWLCYGDNGMCYKGDVTESVIKRFPKPLPYLHCYDYDFPENMHIKTILHKSNNAVFFNPHSVVIDNAYSPSGKQVDKGFFAPIDYSVLFLRHYRTKSLEEWCKNKMSRKGGNSIHFEYNLKKYFACNDFTDEKIEFLYKNGYILKNITEFITPLYFHYFFNSPKMYHCNSFNCFICQKEFTFFFIIHKEIFT